MLITLDQRDMVGFTENLLPRIDDFKPPVIPSGMIALSHVIHLHPSLIKDQNLENIKHYIAGILEGQKNNFL